MKPFRLLAACLAALLLAAALPAAAQTMVRLHTNFGPIDIRLLDAEAPRTVANFLAYVRAGDYDNTFFHRLVRSFALQGGGFEWPDGGRITEVPDRARLANEFDAARSNVRGTVAMAKLAGDPDSATNQWFINLGDNSGPCPGTPTTLGLDCQNGGFSVFGRVTPASMAAAVERIAALQIVKAGEGAYASLPLTGYTSGTIRRSNVVIVTKASELPAAPSDADRIFNALEAAYPQLLGTAPGEPATIDGYVGRRYAATQAAVGTKDGNVYYAAPALGGAVTLLGSVAELLPQAIAAGY